LPGIPYTDHACGLLQLGFREGANRLRGSRFVAVHILRKVSWVSKIVVVLIQAVGHTSKSAQPFESFIMPVSVPLRGPLQFHGSGATFRKVASSSSTAFSISAAVWPGRAVDYNFKNRSENQRLLRRADVQRDLFFVDQFFVKAARLPSAENFRGQIGVRVARLENGSRSNQAI